MVICIQREIYNKMADSNMQRVVDPTLLLELEGLFSQEAPKTADILDSQERVKMPTQSPTSSFPALQRVTDEDTLKKLEEAFSTEITVARKQNLLKVSNPEIDKPTWADWVSPALSISSTLAVGGRGAQIGESLGRSFYPPYGSVVGATVGGLVATIPLVFGSEYAGNAVEDLVEGREFNPDRAFQEAVDAAQTDAIIQIALPVIGTTGKTVYTAGKKLLTGKSGLTDDSIESVVNFQKKLKDFDPQATLLPIQASRGKKTYLTQIASVSQLSKKTVERLLETYDLYMGNQLNDIIRQFRGATPTEQGKALQVFIQQADQAIADIVSPIYKNIDALGKEVIVDPAEAGRTLAKKYRNIYRGKEVVNPETKRRTTRSAYPTSAVSKAVSDLKNLPSNLNFFEAHKRLSKAKQRLYNAQNSTDKDADLIDVLKDTVDMYKGVMDDASSSLSPALKKEYDDVTSFYSRSKDVVSQSFLQKAMNVNDPSEIGALITREGFELPVSQIKELKKLAAELKGKLPKGSTARGLELDPLEGIRKGYLEELFNLKGVGGINNLNTFRKKLDEPKFRATFNELFKGTAVSAKITTVLEELEILNNINKIGGGLQLSIASAEYGVVTGSNPSILKSIRDLVPSFLANREIKTKQVDKLINMIKGATEAEKRGVKLSPYYALELNNLLGVIKIGQGVGAASGTFE